MKIFLDDERACPDGWTPAKTYVEFLELFYEHRDKIVAISFDGDLGQGSANGVSALKRVRSEFCSRKLRDLPALYAHTGTDEMKRFMQDLFAELEEYARKVGATIHPKEEVPHQYAIMPVHP